MALFLLSLCVLIFSIYFYLIGLWYLCFIPLMFFFVLVWYFTSNMNLKTRAFEVLWKYSLFIAWFIILGGLAILFHFFNFSLINISLILVWMNLFLRIWSYLFNYKDWKSIFQFGYYISIFFLLLNAFILTNLHPNISGKYWFFDIFSIVFVAQLGIIWFIVFVVSLKAEIENYMIYKLLFFCIWTVILIVIKEVENLYFALFIWNILLLALYSLIYKTLKKKPPVQEQIVEISVKRILAWERINKKNSDKRQNNFLNAVYNFFDKMPNFMKYFLEFFNTAIILILIVNYILNMWMIQDVYSQILYWFVIACYIVNVYVLKKIWYTNFVQRLLIFLVINFAIYISLFSIYNWNIASAIWWLIVRNIFSNLMIFYTHKNFINKILQKSDYIYWLVSVAIAMIANIILLVWKTKLASQLLFALIFVYLWIQWMILFYSIRYVKDKYFN